MSRLDLHDTSHVSRSARAPLSQAARDAIARYPVPPGYPVDGGVLAARPARRQRPAAPATSKVAARRTAAQEAYAAAWRVAFSPVRGLLTGGFMLYMAGTSVQAFSVMSVVTVGFMQLQGLFGGRSAFRGIVEGCRDVRGRLWGQVVVYFLLCGLGVAAAAKKCGEMGFLPTAESDWVGMLGGEPTGEIVYGGLTM